ncbi:hypothetical protein KYC5002_45630 [Archangium violaceum]|nr:hypothetical protein KYC5002_45630 [Archangium gephyra]
MSASGIQSGSRLAVQRNGERLMKNAVEKRLGWLHNQWVEFA